MYSHINLIGRKLRKMRERCLISSRGNPKVDKLFRGIRALSPSVLATS